MNSYSSQTTNHVGYIVAITVGLFVLISSKDARQLYYNHRKLFLVLLSLPISLIEYFASQIVFWAWMTSSVLAVTERNVLSVNIQPTIYGMQVFLTEGFKSIHGFSIYGISSFFYWVNQKTSFGILVSFSLFFTLTFLLVYVFFGFCFEYYYFKTHEWFVRDAKYYTWFTSNLKKKYIVIALITIIVILAVLVVLITLKTPVLYHPPLYLEGS
jgi:hypothetical protein